jgi:DNA-binding beta-propeller fold protein YncE
VINAAKCNAQVATDCRIIATAKVAASPIAVAVDSTTDTIYVTTGSNSISVINGARCNARVTSGCAKPVATIKVGGVAAAFNASTRTLYVADPGAGVHVVNGATCNAETITGCARGAELVPDKNGPQDVEIDGNTDTIYAIDNGSGDGDTVSVIDGATCNGSESIGCDAVPRTVNVGSGASYGAVDLATDTVYVTNYNDGTVSVINGALCNAAVTSGCTGTPPAVLTGAAAAGIAVDGSLHTVFVENSNDDTLSAIDTDACHGGATSGCPKLAPSAPSGPNQGPGYNAFPGYVTLASPFNSAYLVGIGGPSIVAVVSINQCNATERSGCRVDSPSVPRPEFEAAVDPTTHTVYASNRIAPEIDVIDGATCDATNDSGCAPVAEVPMGAPMAALGAIDDATHTLYASDGTGSGTAVSVINIARCNADDTAGCAHPAARIAVGDDPGAPALNGATHTLYVPFGANADQVAVINTARCNAAMTSGCGQVPSVVNVGEGTYALGVSVKTDTIYAPNAGVPIATADTVSVIDGATCNGNDHAGCGQLAATLTVETGPYGVAVDDATNTVYIANNRDGDAPGTVSVINTATCNGADTTGCHGPFPTAGIGRSPRFAAIDLSTDIVFISDKSSAEVSALNGATCDAAVTSGCSLPVPQTAVGSLPIGLAVNPISNTVYAMTLLVAGRMSILAGQT